MVYPWVETVTVEQVSYLNLDIPVQNYFILFIIFWISTSVFRNAVLILSSEYDKCYEIFVLFMNN